MKLFDYFHLANTLAQNYKSGVLYECQMPGKCHEIAHWKVYLRNEKPKYICTKHLIESLGFWAVDDLILKIKNIGRVKNDRS